jgi:hypothetical protein
VTPEEAFHHLILSEFKKGDKVGELEIIDGPWHNERMSILYFDAPDNSRFRVEVKKVSP